MEKPQQPNWKDSNMALFGSDIEKKIKLAAAEGELQFMGVGETVELKIWRIVNFKVTEWPREQYGSFYDADCYVLLNTYFKTPESKALSYDIHFWIGNDSFADEYGTAAYKAVELDHILGDVATHLHREVMGNETKLFLSYFDEGMKLLKGGAGSGFHHVDVNQGMENTPMLFCVKGRHDKLVLVQEHITRDHFNSKFVYILDIGNKIWQYNGKSANVYEKLKATEFIDAVKCDRGGRVEVTILEEGENDDEASAPEFCTILPQVPVDVKTNNAIDPEENAYVPTLYAVTEDGEFKHLHTVENMFPKSALESQHAVLLDTGFHVFIWIGQHSVKELKVHAMTIAHNYINAFNRPCILPVTRVVEGHENLEFLSMFENFDYRITKS